ncbi:hypothetical protein V6N11_001887 [Hibiscus sabdariffa]|uniref:Uncharacterized protein n=1 Tax=Hibiscus sabdariffa TaxID=183260 RepID=A0ABR2QTZ0_9ROSI
MERNHDPSNLRTSSCKERMICFFELDEDKPDCTSSNLSSGKKLRSFKPEDFERKSNVLSKAMRGVLPLRCPAPEAT